MRRLPKGHTAHDLAQNPRAQVLSSGMGLTGSCPVSEAAQHGTYPGCVLCVSWLSDTYGCVSLGKSLNLSVHVFPHEKYRQ